MASLAKGQGVRPRGAGERTTWRDFHDMLPAIQAHL